MNRMQEVFCYEYLKHGNATRAAESAGYSRRTAYSQGQRLLKHEGVKEVIRKELKQKRDKAVADREERLKFLSDVMRDTEADLKNRLRAVELLSRICGDFIQHQTLEVKATTNLSDLIMEGINGSTSKI